VQALRLSAAHGLQHRGVGRDPYRCVAGGGRSRAGLSRSRLAAPGERTSTNIEGPRWTRNEGATTPSVPVRWSLARRSLRSPGITDKYEPSSSPPSSEWAAKTRVTSRARRQRSRPRRQLRFVRCICRPDSAADFLPRRERKWRRCSQDCASRCPSPDLRRGRRPSCDLEGTVGKRAGCLASPRGAARCQLPRHWRVGGRRTGGDRAVYLRVRDRRRTV
jgi:hypothetical protein